jgi:hypothetical protein
MRTIIEKSHAIYATYQWVLAQAGIVRAAGHLLVHGFERGGPYFYNRLVRSGRRLLKLFQVGRVAEAVQDGRVHLFTLSAAAGTEEVNYRSPRH